MKIARMLLIIAMMGLTMMKTGQADERVANVLWRGVQEFDKAKVTNSMSAAARQPATVGGVARNAIFLHPPGKGRATLDFPAVKVRVERPMRFFFCAYPGMADEIPWGAKERTPDGARFYAVVNGKDLAQAYVQESRWVPMVADMGRVEPGPNETAFFIQLATDPGPNDNSNYDWALFGEPILVALSDEPLPPGSAVPGASGMLIVAVQEGKGAIIVEGLDESGKIVEKAVTKEFVGGTGLTLATFDFTAFEKCVAWRWRPEGVQASQAWGGNYQPALEVTSVGPSQAVTLAGEPVRIRIGVANKGMGPVIASDGVTFECEGKPQPLSRLAPGDTKMLEFPLGPRLAGESTITYTSKIRGQVTTVKSGPFCVWPPLPKLDPKRPEGARTERLGNDYVLLENQFVRWLVHTKAPGMAALVWVWNEDQWQPVGSASPLVEMVDASGAGQDLKLSLAEPSGDQTASLRAEGAWKTEHGAASVALGLSLPGTSEAMEVVVKAKAGQPVNSAIGPAGRLALKPAMPGLPIAGIHHHPRSTPSPLFLFPEFQISRAMRGRDEACAASAHAGRSDDSLPFFAVIFFQKNPPFPLDSNQY